MGHEGQPRRQGPGAWQRQPCHKCHVTACWCFTDKETEDHGSQSAHAKKQRGTRLQGPGSSEPPPTFLDNCGHVC